MYCNSREKTNFRMHTKMTKRNNEFAGAPAVLSIVLAHESTQSSIGTGKFNNMKGDVIFSATKWNFIQINILHRFTKKDDQNARNIAPIYSYVFGVAEFESVVRISPSGHNFFLTSKTCFPAFIFFQAQMSFKNSAKIHRSVFLYHKLP